MNPALTSWPQGARVDRVITLTPCGHNWSVSRVTRAGKTLRVEALGQLTPGSSASTLPKNVPDEAASPGTWVVMALPAMEVVARRLEAPFGDVAKARQVFPALLEGYLPFALEKCVHELLEVRRTKNGHVDTLAVAVRRDEMDRHIGLCRDAGLCPAVIDAEGLALWRQASRESAASAEHPYRVVAYAGQEHIILVAGHHGEFQDVLVFKTNASGPGSTESERSDLARRVLRRWRALPPEWTNARQEWLWCGPEADEEARESLTRLIAPDGAVSRILPDPASFLERALATPLLLDGHPALNLMPADAAPPALRQSQGGMDFRVALAWIVAALIPFSAAVAWKLEVARRGASLRDQALRGYEQITGAPCPQPELVQVLAPRAMNDLRNSLRPFLPAGESFTAAMREMLSAAHEQGLQADKVELAPGGLRIQGAQQSPQDAAALVQRLAGRGRVASAEAVPAGRWAVLLEVAP